MLFLQKYQVSFSMLEIYNEQVRDLLVKNNPKGGLQVRLKADMFAHYHLFFATSPMSFFNMKPKSL